MREILCNKYEVLRTIAEGGMGCVYLVKDLHLNRLCAVKVSKGREEQRRSFAIAEKELLKRLTGRCYPVFIDDSESVDHIPRPSGQALISKKVADQPLKVQVKNTPMNLPKAG